MSAPERSPVFVLAVDDEPQIRRLLTLALEAAGYHVSTAGSGQEALTLAARQRQDLIILDLGLPDMDGLSVLKQLREWTQVPVIILTVREGQDEKVEALDGGADDYVTKPFNTEELLARMRATLRRYDRGGAEAPVVRFGDVEVDLAYRRVTLKGQPVKLTATEYSLFHFFIKHAGKALTHRQLLREVWGPNSENQTSYLRVYMARLREKLEPDPASPPLFVTEAGVGYRLVESRAEPSA